MEKQTYSSIGTLSLFIFKPGYFSQQLIHIQRSRLDILFGIICQKNSCHLWYLTFRRVFDNKINYIDVLNREINKYE